MAKHDRNLITVNCIEAFSQFAIASGAKVREGKGAYQLLQIRIKGQEWHAICANAQGTVSTPPAIRGMIDRFKRGTKAISASAATYDPSLVDPRAISLPAGSAALVVVSKPKPPINQYAADLRDDAAIRMMAALFLKLSNPHEADQQTIDANAKFAYRMADALLVAGGHA